MNMVARSDFVVHIQGLCIDPPNFCMIMELKKGGDLYKLLHSGKTIEWPLRMTYAQQITKGLNFIHQYMLHRDLKSLNVLLNEDQTVASVSDFGLAEPKTESMGASLAVETLNHYGTPYWMAPESLAVLAEYSVHSDVYGLGMIFYEWALQKVPFQGVPVPVAIQAIQKGDCPDIDSHPIPPGFAKLIKLCWDQTPKNRPETKQLIVDLEQCIKDVSKPKV